MYKYPGNLVSRLPGVSDSIFAIMSQQAVKDNALNLSQGFPDFNCPQELISLVHKYMKAGYNQYAPMPGITDLKKKIARKVKKIYDASYNPDYEILITAGATQALYASITAMIREGDEVLLFEPAYDSYAPVIQMNKGIPKYVKLHPPDYKINWDDVKRNITFNTRMIIINTPHNPTGSVLSEDDMIQLERIINNRDIIILSDEVYQHIIFDEKVHHSVCRFPKLIDKSIAVFSFGKTYHTTGWKMGYILAPQNIMAEIRKVFQFMMFAVSTPVQMAYADFLDNEDHYMGLNAFYQKKRDIFLEGIRGSRFDIIPCSGTYFQCLSYKNISDQKDMDFALKLSKKHKIASIPLSPFHHEKTDEKILRFCFAKSEETLKKAAEILCKV